MNAINQSAKCQLVNFLHVEKLLFCECIRYKYKITHPNPQNKPLTHYRQLALKSLHDEGKI